MKLFTKLVFSILLNIGIVQIANAQPTISSFSPKSAAPGTSVTINGTNFNTTAGNNIVFFGATRATVTAATATQITVTVPTSATYAPITELNTGTQLACYSLSNFNPIYSPAKAGINGSDFAAKVDFTSGTGTNPYSVAIGDLDGDGKPDLVVTNNLSAGTVSVFRNIGSNGSITSGSFATHVDFAVGSFPMSVAIGDLDGDGKPDLAIANNGNMNGVAVVSVLRNTATSGSITNGSFAAHVDYAVGGNPNSVAIGDLDRDGKPDLVIANGSNSVSILRNTSTSGSITSGSFAAKVDFATGSNPYSVAIGDIDGDGKPDLVSANWGDNTVSVLRNTATSGSITSGSFAANVDFATGTGPYSVAIGDIDGDDKPDLAVANREDNTVSVLYNTATSGSVTNGSFAPHVDFATGNGPFSLAIGDLDGDGKPDLALANAYDNTVSVLRNTSTSGSITSGSFAVKVDFATGSNPYSLAVGDLDGDGKPDLVTPNYSPNGTVSVFHNNTIVPPPTITSFSPTSAKTGTSVTITGTNFNTTAANNIVFFGATQATVTAATATQLTVTVPTSATYAPISELNTGSQLACYSLSNFNPIYSPSKTGIVSADFAAKVDFTLGAATAFQIPLAISDLDGDGKPDLVSANGLANTVSVFRNTSTSGSISSGSFASPVNFASGSGHLSIAIGDLDGDGKPDLAVVNLSDNTVSVFRNTSTTGNISFAARVDFATSSIPHYVSIGDVDGDGKLDLAVACWSSNTVSVFRNTSTSGNISFAARVDFATAQGPESVAIGDLDGDGKPDLAVANSSGYVSVLRNTATSGNITSGSFATRVDFAAGQFAYSVVIGDLDADGKADLAVTNYNSNTVSVLRNTATSGNITSSSFAAHVDFATGGTPQNLAIGDLDGDGKPDLVVPNSASGVNTVSVFRNTATSGSITSGSFAGKVDFATGAQPWSVAIGDLDGDGESDLAVANSAANSISILHNTTAVAPPAVGTITQPSCVTATASVVLSGLPTPGNWTINPGAITGSGISTTISGLTANTTYNFKVTNSAGSTSAASANVVINAQPAAAPSAPIVTVTQPTCAVVTGTINVNSPTGAGITYSIGGSYQSGTTFNNVSSGTYSVTAMGTGGCVSSPTFITVNAVQPTPSAPIVSVTQPTCAVTTGTIIITAPAGAGITYSIDGVNYQSSATFSNVIAGSYSITAKSASGCISSVTSATVNPQPSTPTAPIVTVTQPTCAVATGAITVTAPTGAGMTYSIDGVNYQSSATFSNLIAGAAFFITAKSAGGCISSVLIVTLNAQPTTPSAPIVTVTQTTCAVATGTINITAPIGAGYSYSIDGVNYQSSVTFSNVAAGSYTVTVKNAGGCTSAGTATVNVQPVIPVIADITGAATVCISATTALADATASGSWSSSDNSIATVDNNGIVTGIAAGTATISYTVTNSCGNASKTLLVTITDCSGAVSGGGGGGLESHDLGDAVAQRVYAKAYASQNGKVDYNKLSIVGAANQTARPTTFGVGVSSVTLASIMPDITKIGFVAYNSTPTDIVTLTNATEVIATDFTVNQQPKAVAFATKTLGALYDHTKPICDRLKGASLLDVQNITVGGYNFVQYTMKDENGITEYATSFSVGTKAGRSDFSIQSTWLSKDYVSDDVMYNFQLWAATPQLVNAMITDVLTKVQTMAAVTPLVTTNIPATYVMSGNRTGTNLDMVITNTAAGATGYFTLEDKASESSTGTTATRQIPFTVNANGKSTVSIPMNDLYESTITMYVNGVMKDVVYMSDGTWSVDYNKVTTTVNSFTISNDANRVYDPSEYAVLRNASVKGNSSDYVSVFKLLRGGAAETDLSAYKGLKLTAAGGYTLRVTLVKNSIVNWNDQYYTEIKLDDAQKDYYISMDKFASTASTNKITANDVTTVVFAIEVGTGRSAAINTTLSNISFTKVDQSYINSLDSKEIQLYPNPATAKNFSCSFYSNQAQQLTLHVTDVMGRTVATQQVSAIKGLNVVPVALKSGTNGMHIVSLDGADVKYNSKKAIIN